MGPFALLVPLFILALPAIEIAVFILVGSKIGVLATLGLILAGILIGAALLRAQGFALLTRMRAEMDAGRVPGEEMIQGVLLLVAALMVLTPGFVTSAFGFLLLIPQVRRALVGLVRSRMTVVVRTRREGAGVVDLDPDDYQRRGGPAETIILPPPGRSGER